MRNEHLIVWQLGPRVKKVLLTEVSRSRAQEPSPSSLLQGTPKELSGNRLGRWALTPACQVLEASVAKIHGHIPARKSSTAKWPRVTKDSSSEESSGGSRKMVVDCRAEWP